jgi:hypothetical protein
MFIWVIILLDLISLALAAPLRDSSNEKQTDPEPTTPGNKLTKISMHETAIFNVPTNSSIDLNSTSEKMEHLDATPRNRRSKKRSAQETIQDGASGSVSNQKRKIPPKETSDENEEEYEDFEVTTLSYKNDDENL